MGLLARMPGRYGRPWCPVCHKPAGPDCPTRSRSGRQVRQRLKRDLDREPHDDDDQEAPWLLS